MQRPEDPMALGPAPMEVHGDVWAVLRRHRGVEPRERREAVEHRLAVDRDEVDETAQRVGCQQDPGVIGKRPRQRAQRRDRREQVPEAGRPQHHEPRAPDHGQDGSIPKTHMAFRYPDGPP